jgi:hypothetical protein
MLAQVPTQRTSERMLLSSLLLVLLFVCEVVENGVQMKPRHAAQQNLSCAARRRKQFAYGSKCESEMD